MLALLYLGVAICVGERLCSCYFRFVSLAHRWATGALAGLLLSTGFTYLAARHLAGTSDPLVWGNLLFFAAASIFLLNCRPKRHPSAVPLRVSGSETWDWVALGLYGALASWMMFATLDLKAGTLLIGVTQWSDYGPNTALVQSFVHGHNFPAEYPHFAGEPIRYHFLFYFQAGNLEFLGLNLVWSLNLLSVLTTVCMLAVIMALGELLFKSRAVGVLASALFFFHGTLNLLPFLRAQTSIKGALWAISKQGSYLTSGYPYRGEDWGIWTQVVFINQRHLASSIGIFLIVLFFLLDRYLEWGKQEERVQAWRAPAEPRPWPAAARRALAAWLPARLLNRGPKRSPLVEVAATSDKPASLEPLAEAPDLVSAGEEQSSNTPESPGEAETPDTQTVGTLPPSEPSSWEPDTRLVSEEPSSPAPGPEPVDKSWRGLIAELVQDNLHFGRGFIFSGLLLGALPYWNAPVFTAAFAVLLFLFVLFPCRRYMLGLAITTALVGLPQVLALRLGNARAGASLIHWGYTLGNVPITQVLKYLGFTFGLKWVLLLVGLICGSWLHLRLFIAICSLFLLTFCFQFSEEVLANHKFLNIWLVVANVFVAYGLWRLWRLRIKGWALPSRLAAILLASPIVAGGIIDLFPIHNATFVHTAFANDRLIKWIQAETKPNSVFLTDKFVNHPILLAGRRIFFGFTYFTWSAGYDLSKREAAYRQMFESKNAHQVFTLLKANKIDYVAFDVTVRGTFKNHNEKQVYVPNFKKVFEASDYWQLTIYKVPENADFVPASPAAGPGNVPATGVSAFEGGKGKDNGQFDFPRGLTVDRIGNILVADTNNGRIQRFSPVGAFLGLFGKTGQGPGEFREPGGLAVDSSGNIYVADHSNNRVQKLKPDGSFLAEWKGPEPGFFGPRDIAIGSDNLVYVVDQGHARIVKLDLNGKVIAIWGGRGQGDGQFSEASGLAVDAKNNRVYVADPRNKRIEVFDTNGGFIATWPVEQWVPTGWYFQGLTVDPQAGRLYAASPTDEVLVFDLTGKRIASLKPKPPDKLEGASCLALVKGKLYVLNTYGSRVSQIELEQK